MLLDPMPAEAHLDRNPPGSAPDTTRFAGSSRGVPEPARRGGIARTLAHITAITTLHPQDARGKQILDEFERHGEILPFAAARDGTRSYSLLVAQIDSAEFELMVDRISPDWRTHVSRTD